MDLVQLFIFLLLPLSISLYSLFGTKEVKLELLVFAYIFAHQSSGITLLGFSLSFEKVISILLILHMMVKKSPRLKKTTELIPIGILFLAYFSYTSIVNEVYSGILRVIFDLIQIFVLPIFLYSLKKYRKISLNRLAKAFYRIGIIILFIQIYELYVNEDFYVYTQLHHGFENYIGSITRNNTLRASSLFAQVSAAGIFALIGILITSQLNKSLKFKAIFIFCAIIYFTGTRLCMGLAIIFLFLDLFPEILRSTKTITVISLLLLAIAFNNIDSIINYISLFTRSATESALLDSSMDSSLYERTKQFNYSYNFLFEKNAFFGFGRDGALRLIESISEINSCDSRILLYLFFGGIPGVVIYFILWKKLLFFESSKKHRVENQIRSGLIAILVLFMSFSSISDYFFLIGLILPIIYNYKNESVISQQQI